MGIDASYHKSKKDDETPKYSVKIHPLTLITISGMICITVIVLANTLSGGA